MARILFQTGVQSHNLKFKPLLSHSQALPPMRPRQSRLDYADRLRNSDRRSFPYATAQARSKPLHDYEQNWRPGTPPPLQPRQQSAPSRDPQPNRRLQHPRARDEAAASAARTRSGPTAPGARAVMGPAEDGGYYLLGVKSAEAHLLKDIPWSTAEVAARTRERAAEIGLTLTELPEWYDVDDQSALALLIEHLSAPPVQAQLPYPAPATAALLRRWGMLEPDLRKYG